MTDDQTPPTQAMAESTSPTDTPPPDPSALPPADEGRRLTKTEIDAIVRVLYKPTVQRMTILTKTLIEQTTTIDFFVWAPLATLENVLQTAKVWGYPQSPRLLALASRALMTMAAKLEGYEQELVAHMAAGGTHENAPPPPDFTQEDTDACYVDALARHPDPEAPPS